MNLVLRYWFVRWRSVLFNIEDGRGRVSWFLPPPKIERGWANKFQGQWFALWNSDVGLVFQVNSEKWKMKNFKCEHFYNDQGSEIRIIKDDEYCYIYKYVFRNKEVFDDLDLFERDFLYFVYAIWNEPSLRRGFESAWPVAGEPQFNESQVTLS